MKKCKHCKEPFQPYNSLQKFCFETECSKVWIETEKEKQWRKRKRELKEELETVQSLLVKAQSIFNTWIRLRDKECSCISCGKRLPNKYDAGHYIASGKSKFLTMNPLNVHAQCVECNKFKHANLVEYRINLIKKIGLDKVEWLEDNRHKTKHYTREELKQLIETYKKKIADLK